jgi:putative transposase
MRKGDFSEEKIIGVLREHEAGAKVEELCRRHGISTTTLYKWKAKYGGMTVPEAKRLRGLEEENRRLKNLLADAMLDNDALKGLLSKNVWPAPSARVNFGWPRRSALTYPVSGLPPAKMEIRAIRA